MARKEFTDPTNELGRNLIEAGLATPEIHWSKSARIDLIAWLVYFPFDCEEQDRPLFKAAKDAFAELITKKPVNPPEGGPIRNRQAFPSTPKLDALTPHEQDALLNIAERLSARLLRPMDLEGQAEHYAEILAGNGAYRNNILDLLNTELQLMAKAAQAAEAKARQVEAKSGTPDMSIGALKFHHEEKMVTPESARRPDAWFS